MSADNGMEKLSDIEEELRSLSKCEEYRIDAEYAERHPTVRGKPVVVYFGEIADRILEARRRDERLMLKLLDFAIEDYYDDWASDDFRATVKSACSRLGMEYCKRQGGLVSQIEVKIAEIDNSARIMCKLDTAHRCVDCELCKGDLCHE